MIYNLLFLDIFHLPLVLYLIIGTIVQSRFEVLGTEVEFGEKGKYKPIRLTLEDGKRIEIIGKIDRIDTAQGEDGPFSPNSTSVPNTSNLLCTIVPIIYFSAFFIIFFSLYNMGLK